MSTCPHCGSSHGADNHFCPVTGQPIDLGPRLISQSLLDRFRIVTILGEGSIGIVVEVEEKGSGRRYAAKMIHPQYSRDPQAAEKTLDDAKRAGGLNCIQIAEVVKVGRDDGAAITVVRELMTGESLQNRMDQRKRLSEGEAIKITRQILLALDAIHSAGIVNLDLSPSDVFITKTGDEEIVKLVDIGEYHIKQKLILDNSEDLESRNYYAPELFDRSRQINPKSDIYAAGAILYYMINGEIPSTKPDANASPPNNVSNDLAQVMRKALSATPHNRYQSARAFIDELDKIAAPGSPDGQAPVSLTKTAPCRPYALATAMTEAATGSDAASCAVDSKVEFEQPSVIVDMPEMEKPPSILNSRKLGIAAVVGATILVAGAILFISSKKEKIPDKIQILVQIDPPQATVFIDGAHVEGNPVTVETVPDKQLHTISAKANGFEPLERDVKFDVSQRIDLSLTEIIQPDEEPKPPAEPLKAEAVVEEPAKLTPPPQLDATKEELLMNKTGEAQAEPAKNEPEKTASKQKTEAKQAAKPKPKQKAKTDTKKKSREGFTTTNPFD